MEGSRLISGHPESQVELIFKRGELLFIITLTRYFSAMPPLLLTQNQSHLSEWAGCVVVNRAEIDKEHEVEVAELSRKINSMHQRRERKHTDGAVALTVCSFTAPR